MKKALSLLLSMAFLFALCAIASALETQEAVTQGRTVCADALVLWDNGNYACTTLAWSAAYQPDAPCGAARKNVSAYFNHAITNGSSEFDADFSVTITGEVSDNDAAITGLTVSLGNPSSGSISYHSLYSGSSATVYIKLNGAAIGSLGYKISLDGPISEV